MCSSEINYFMCCQHNNTTEKAKAKAAARAEAEAENKMGIPQSEITNKMKQETMRENKTAHGMANEKRVK